MENQSVFTKTIMIGIGFCILTGFFWGTTGVARALGPPEATSMGVAGVRSVVAAAAMLIICLFSGTFKNLGPVGTWPWKEMAFAGFSLGFTLWAYLESMKLAGVSLGTPINCASISIFALLIEVIFMKVRPSKGQLAGLITCGVGGVMVSFFASGGEQFGTFDAVIVKGILLSVLAGAVFCLYSLGIQRAVRNGFPFNAAITGMFVFASIAWFPYAMMTEDMSWLNSTRGVLMTIYLGVFSAAGGYFCYVRGIARVPVSIAVSLGMAEPFTATALGTVLLGERLNTMTWISMVILFFGIYYISRATVNKNKQNVAA